MRRFIDVDKLEADVEYWENHDDPKKPDYDTRDIEQVIGFQPIVEAIPVEWLKTQIEKCQEISNTSKTVGLAILAETIKQWEKENGTDRQR